VKIALTKDSTKSNRGEGTPSLVKLFRRGFGKELPLKGGNHFPLLPVPAGSFLKKGRVEGVADQKAPAESAREEAAEQQGWGEGGGRKKKRLKLQMSSTTGKGNQFSLRRGSRGNEHRRAGKGGSDTSVWSPRSRA